MSELKSVVLAGGCFWGMEDLIRKQSGVVDTEVGYTGGQNDHPTYRNHPGHAEAIEVKYNSDETDVRKLLDFFFQIHNPTTLNQQGNDLGTSYRSTIFFANEEERKIAEEMIEIVNQSKRWDAPVVTTLEPLKEFWPAEPEHQDYLDRNPGVYTCHMIYIGSYLSS